MDCSKSNLEYARTLVLKGESRREQERGGESRREKERERERRREKEIVRKKGSSNSASCQDSSNSNLEYDDPREMARCTRLHPLISLINEELERCLAIVTGFA